MVRPRGSATPRPPSRHLADSRPVAASHRPRRLRFGPGLALALGALVLLWPALRNGLQAGAPRARPRIDRSRLAEIPAPPAAPELGWLLVQEDALGLKPAQVEKLRRLKRRWDEDTRPLRETLDRTSAQFNQEMASHPGSRVSLQNLQERAASVSELSRQLAEARRACWRETAGILSATQTIQAEDAWTRGLGFRRAPPPHS